LNGEIKNDLSEGSVLKKLTLFALPFLASNLTQSMYNVADMLIVGRFSGAASMSGVNIGGQMTFILTNVVAGLAMGATVLIGQYVGAKQDDALKRVTATIITLLTAVSVALTVAIMPLRGPILRLIQTPADSFAESESYLTVTVLGLVFIFLYNALSAILRGMGDSKHPLYFVLAACITNIALDLIFVAVFKWAAFGAALATVMSQAMSVMLCVIYMMRHKFSFDFKPRSFKIHKDQLALICRIGLPTCVQNSVTSLSFLFITALVNMVGGMAGSAAVGAAGKLGSFVFMPAIAISASISTMCAQNIGANRLDRAVQACKIGTVAAFLISAAMFAVIRLYPAQMMALFSNDLEVIGYGVIYLRSFSFEFLVIPFIFCFNGLLMGGGHTVFTLVNSVISSIAFRVPACWFLGVYLGLGLSGIGYGAPLADAGALLIVIGYLFTGNWKTNAAIKATAKTPT
jgi:putative MATE family efflux protein